MISYFHLVLWGIIIVEYFRCNNALQLRLISKLNHQFVVTSSKTTLFSNDPRKTPTQSVGMKGYYVRPSRAIERGGGFFIPGLEDEKLRIIAALVLIGLSALNLAGVQSQTLSLNVSVTTGIIISLLLFWQGIANTLFSNTWVPAASNSTNSFLTCIQRDPRLPQIEVACISIINSIPDVKSVVVLQVTERIHDETKSMLPLSVLSQWGSLNQSPISLSRLPHEEVCLKQQLFQSPRQIQFYDTINNNSGFLSLLESGGNQQFMEVYIPESQTIWILAKDQVDNKRPIENERDGDFFLSMASIPLGL